jgi:two-component system response regulator LytT
VKSVAYFHACKFIRDNLYPFNPSILQSFNPSILQSFNPSISERPKLINQQTPKTFALPMNILIIEDEIVAAEKLKRQLNQYDSTIEVLAHLESVEESVAWLQAHPEAADLIFLDIHLADGLSFSIFEQVKVNTPIIFTTAYDQYALKAFEVNSLAYLLKPIKKAELARSLEKYEELQARTDAVDFQQLAALMREQKPLYQKRFLVYAGEKIKSVPVEDTAYFFAEQRYVFLVTQDGQRHIIDKTLDKLESLLDPDRFFRINRKFLISIESIGNMVSWSKSRVKVELQPPSEAEAIVSVDRSGNFKQWLDR